MVESKDLGKERSIRQKIMSVIVSILFILTIISLFTGVLKVCFSYQMGTPSSEVAVYVVITCIMCMLTYMATLLYKTKYGEDESETNK